MKNSDKERLKKIIATWESLSQHMKEHSITPEKLLGDELNPRLSEESGRDSIWMIKI